MLTMTSQAGRTVRHLHSGAKSSHSEKTYLWAGDETGIKCDREAAECCSMRGPAPAQLHQCEL